MTRTGLVERIGHRGAKRELPENTLPAFARAFERGADAVELDVHATSDGVVVVHHDPAAHGPSGALLTIAETPWAVLATVDFGSGIGIPRLSDVLAAAPQGATVYVEIKGQGIERAVAECIRQSSARCAVHSFDHDAIVRMREIAPEIPRGILFEGAIDTALSELERTGARDVWPQWKLIDAPLIDAVRSAGGRVIAWTVNDSAVAARLASMGIDGLCGDDVRVFEENLP